MDIDLDFPDKWVITRLNDIAFYKKGPFGSSLKKDIFIPKSENSVKVYEQQNAIKKDYQLGNYYISLEKYEQMKSFSVFPNDIIVSCAGTVGESYIVPTNAPIGIINQALMIARLYDKDMMPYFLIYFDSVLKKQAKEDSKGTAIKNIPPFDVLKNYIIAIPPINEQKRIVAKINELFAIVEIIEQNKKELDELKELAKSKVLDLAIQGKLVEQDPNDEPASILLERIRAEKEQMVRDGKLKKRDIANDSIIYKGDDNCYYEKYNNAIEQIDNKMISIPLTWEWSRLNSICTLITDGTHQTPKYAEEGYVFLSSKNVTSGKINWKDIMYIPKELHEKLHKRLSPKKGDILLAKNGTTGKSAIVDKDIIFDIYVSLALIRVISDKSIVSKYLKITMDSDFVQNYFKGSLKGIGVPNLHLENIRNALIPIPPINEQYKIVELIESINKKLEEF